MGAKRGRGVGPGSGTAAKVVSLSRGSSGRCQTPIPRANYLRANAVCNTPESKPDPAVPVVAKRYSAAE